MCLTTALMLTLVPERPYQLPGREVVKLRDLRGQVLHKVLRVSAAPVLVPVEQEVHVPGQMCQVYPQVPLLDVMMLTIVM